MSEKRRVLGSTAVAGNSSDTPTRNARASPSVAGAGGGAARVRAIINNTGTTSPSGLAGSNAATPTTRTTTPGRSTFSPAASAAVLARARVLGYDQPQESSTSGSPLAGPGASQRAGPSTPGVSANNGPATPASVYTPSSSSATTTSASAAARAQVKTSSASASGSTAGLAARKIRAASTPPHNDSPTISRPVSPRRRAFPAFGMETRSSSPSNQLPQAGPRVRPISGVRSNTVAVGALPRAAAADPVKPPMYHSKSMTTRPTSAASDALLPSPTIRATPSSIFPSSSSTSAPVARIVASPSLGNGTGQSPSPSTSRPLSPVRLRPTSPVRPASPKRGEAFRPKSALSPSSPRRPPLASSTFGAPSSSSTSHALSISPPSIAVGTLNAKRPSTSSQSSSSHSYDTADTSGTTNTTTTTAATCFSPDLNFSDSNDDQLQKQQQQRNSLASTSSTSMNGYHRTRRRSHSTNSSISSTSGLSSNVSKTKAFSGSNNNTRHSRTGSASGGAGVNVGIGIGMKIPNVSSPTASAVGLSTSPQIAGGLTSPHRQAPSSPGKSFFSEVTKLERQAHLDAKVHRKILDLEITNTSLLAINASLEKAKAKQSAELRELRRRIRDRTSFAPLSSSSNNLLSPLSDDFSWDPLSGLEKEQQDTEMTWEEILKEDEKFADMVRLLDSMNRRGKEALEKTVKSEEKSLGGPKVLNHFDVPPPAPSSIAPSLGASKKSLTSTLGSGSLGSGSTRGEVINTSVTSSAKSTVRDWTLEPDTTVSETGDETDVTNESSTIDTSRTSSHQLEASDGDGSLTSSSFDISRGMASTSEFSISID